VDYFFFTQRTCIPALTLEINPYCKSLATLMFGGVAIGGNDEYVAAYELQPCFDYLKTGVRCDIPVLNGIGTSKLKCEVSEQISLTSLYYLPIGDSNPVSFIWSATAGTIDNPTAQNITWTAPSTVGTHTFSCVVTDPAGADVEADGVVRAGANRFRYRGAFHTAPTGTLCTVTPDEAHSVEPAGDHGFAYWCLYPSIDLVTGAAEAVRGKRPAGILALPPVIEDAEAAGLLCAVFEAEAAIAPRMARETRLLALLSHVLVRHATASVVANGKPAGASCTARVVRSKNQPRPWPSFTWPTCAPGASKSTRAEASTVPNSTGWQPRWSASLVGPRMVARL